jgi:hypothetical protein
MHELSTLARSRAGPGRRRNDPGCRASADRGVFALDRAKENSMSAYQAQDALDTYRASAVFIERCF